MPLKDMDNDKVLKHFGNSRSIFSPMQIKSNVILTFWSRAGAS